MHGREVDLVGADGDEVLEVGAAVVGDQHPARPALRPGDLADLDLAAAELDGLGGIRPHPRHRSRGWGNPSYSGSSGQRPAVSGSTTCSASNGSREFAQSDQVRSSTRRASETASKRTT